MLARHHALVSLAIAAGATSMAAAAPVDLPNTRATLDVDDGWSAIDRTEAMSRAGIVVAYRSGPATWLVITRAAVANTDAWRPQTRDRYVDGIASGLTVGLERSRHTTRIVDGVPTLDVEARHPDGRRVLARVLLMRTYALTAVIEVPRDGDLTRGRRTLQSFRAGPSTGNPAAASSVAPDEPAP